MSPAERSFFGVLQLAVGSDYLVFPKVRLADIVVPVKGMSKSGWQTAFNKITGKHIDFILCEPSCLKVVAAVELDDDTHWRFDRSFRDNLVDCALADADIPILRVKARETYSPASIRERLDSMINHQQPPFPLFSKTRQ